MPSPTQMAANLTSNGLRATRESIFQTNPIEQYAFATFQALRAQRFEIQTQSRWEQSPDDQNLFVQMERTAKLGAIYVRRAAVEKATDNSNPI